jgi:hypothetical protein
MQEILKGACVIFMYEFCVVVMQVWRHKVGIQCEYEALEF